MSDRLDEALRKLERSQRRTDALYAELEAQQQQAGPGNLSPFSSTPEGAQQQATPASTREQVLAMSQADLKALKERDPAGFDRLLDALREGRI